MARYLFLLALLVGMTGCGSNVAPTPTSDSGQKFATSLGIPIDDTIYVLTGDVIGDIRSLSRQTASGSLSGSTGSGGIGYVSGSYYSETSGKGFVRFHIAAITPGAPFAAAGDVVLLKSTDSKIAALLPGDKPVIKCRAQYENLAAVRENESFTADKVTSYGTWEFDYCRLATPQLGQPEK